MAHTVADWLHISPLEVPGLIISEAFLRPYKESEGLLDNWFEHRQQLDCAFVHSVLMLC